MHIYYIKNKTTGKIYIGQTTTKVAYRWRGHIRELERNSHKNSYLQRSWNKYGKNDFEFSILCECQSLEELNRKEIEYISKYNSTAENDGYNLTEGGKNGLHLQVTKNLMSKKRSGIFWSDERKENRSKTWKRKRKYPIYLKNSDGIIHEINYFKQFCRANQLDAAAICRVLNKKVSAHKGWTLPDTKKMSPAERLSKTIRPQGYPFLISPDGNIHEINILNQFGKKHKMNIACLHNLVTGKKLQYKGWIIL